MDSMLPYICWAALVRLHSTDIRFRVCVCVPCGVFGMQVDLRHMDERAGSNVVDVGVDLSEFYMSVEWDILDVPAVRYGLNAFDVRYQPFLT